MLCQLSYRGIVAQRSLLNKAATETNRKKYTRTCIKKIKTKHARDVYRIRTDEGGAQ